MAWRAENFGVIGAIIAFQERRPRYLSKKRNNIRPTFALLRDVASIKS